MQHVDRGSRVGESAVIGSRVSTEVCGQGSEAVVAHLVAWDEGASELHGVDDVGGGPVDGVAGARSFEKADVESGVVGHENAVMSEELEEGRQNPRDAWGVIHHARRDAGEALDLDGDLMAGVDQRGELSQDLAAAYLHGADLGDALGLGASARRLEIDHDEGHVDERRAEVTERRLHTRLRCRDLHAPHGRCRHRQPLAPRGSMAPAIG